MRRIRKYSMAERFGYIRPSVKGRATPYEAIKDLRRWVEQLEHEMDVCVAALERLGLVRMRQKTTHERLRPSV